MHIKYIYIYNAYYSTLEYVLRARCIIILYIYVNIYIYLLLLLAMHSIIVILNIIITTLA